MYLAIVRDREGTRFVLRHSFQNREGGWESRDVIDLGKDPEEFINYIDDRVFLISQDVLDAIWEKGIEYEYEELEEIFWPFVDPEIRQTIEDFGGIRGRGHKRTRSLDKDELKKMQRGIHYFDRRRLLFLKFLHMNIEPLMDEPFPFLNRLLDKSRDEIEQDFEFMEMDLRPWEMKNYIYSIFGLPDRFSGRLTRFIPEAQDEETMDKFFLEELCRLNCDNSYIDIGARPSKAHGLHPYLRRYLFQYFDFIFKSKVFRGIGGGQFRPKAPSNESEDDFLKAMDLTREDFEKMDEREFISFFRKKALKMHPDTGGDHKKFIRLKEAFEFLIVKKKWS